jgi:hypothetical protein
LNTIFIGAMFIGGAAGSAAATAAWRMGGWGSVSMLGLGLATVAALFQVGYFVSR